MSDTLVEDRKEAAQRSVTRDNAFPVDRGGGYFQILIPSAQGQWGVLPPYLPIDFRERERVLASTVHADAMWSAAIGIAITKAAALAWETKSESKLKSERAQELLLSADVTSISGIGGWVSYMGKQVRNFTCTNGGCFTEIIRKTGAYGSKIVGLGHLSSLRMRRTGDPEYPFIYLDRWGRQHVMRWWQVFNLVDMPDPDEAFLGMGMCAAERAYQQIRKLSALEMYLYEKISGSKPLALHIINGLTKDQLTDMMSSARDSQTSKGLAMYMGAIVATTLKPDAAPSLVTIPLAELPDGFEAVQERDRADLIYANALGLDPQDLKPMSNQQMGAGAQSEVLNQKAEGRGQAAYRQQLTHMLNQLVFDDKTQFLFTEHDYRDQKAAADVSTARGAFISGLVEKQLISPQQGLQVLIEQGELPKAFIEEGAQAGSDLSDTDKPDVQESLNDQSGPPQPTNQPVMQTQTPVATPPSGSAPQTGATAAPQPVIEKKALTPHQVKARHIQAGAHRILRQLRRGGAIRTKADSGGVWRYIHGHPVLIKGGGGGGGGGSGGGGSSGGKGSGGKGKSKTGGGSGAATASGTKDPATPKTPKKNVPTHGAGGTSKYPTLDAYKKGQITHENALSQLQHDIKAAKLAGDTKAVNTLNTQYYGLKKAGPKPTSGLPEPGHPGTNTTASGVVLPVVSPNSPAAQHLSNVAKVDSLAGTGIHSHTMGMDDNIKKGIATEADVKSTHDKIKSEIDAETNKVVQAQNAIDAVKSQGSWLTPPEDVVKIQTEAKAKIEALHALDKHLTATEGLYGVKKTATPDISKLTDDPDFHAAKADLTANNWLDYHNKSKVLAAKYGVPLDHVKNSVAAAPGMTQATAAPVHSTLPSAASKMDMAMAASGAKANHITAAESLYMKHQSGKIATATYNTQMYKLAKESGVPKAKLEQAVGTLNETTITPPKTTNKPKSKLENDPLGTVVGPPAVSLQKTTNPLTSLSGDVAAKVAAMPESKQDLIKLGAVYDQHGGSSTEYNAAIVAYNAKHGTTLNYSSAGPAVKNAKQEAGIPLTATKQGLSPTTSSGMAYTPGLKYDQSALDAVAAKHNLPNGAVKDSALLNSQYTHGVINASEYQTKMDALAAKHGKSNYEINSAGMELATKDSAYGSYTKANLPPSPTKTFKGKEYETPQSITSANAWGDKHFANWHANLTSGEKEAFIGYSKHGDGPINNFLRKGELGDENNDFAPQKPSVVHKRIKHLDDAIAKTSIPTDVVAVRGFSHKGLVDMMVKGQDLGGAVFHDNAFVSTSVNNKGGFSGNIKMHIHIPKGSKGAYMDGSMKLTKFPGEAELLLGRDSNFRIVGYKKGATSWAPWELEVEYLGTGPIPAGAYKSFKADN